MREASDAEEWFEVKQGRRRVSQEVKKMAWRGAWLEVREVRRSLIRSKRVA